jgi:hypothetical protein
MKDKPLKDLTDTQKQARKARLRIFDANKRLNQYYESKSTGVPLTYKAVIITR